MKTATVTDLSQTPLHVLEYFAPISGDAANELHRRKNAAMRERVTVYFADLVSQIRDMATGPGTWPAIADFILSPSVDRKLNDRNVTIGTLLDVAGVSYSAVK